MDLADEVDALLNSGRPITAEQKSDILKKLGFNGEIDKEAIRRDLEDRFLKPKPVLPAHWLPDFQICWRNQLDIRELLHLETSVPFTTLEFQTAGLDGHVTGYKEVSRITNRAADSKTSTSMQRAPADHSTFIRGKSGYFPFAPGGLAAPESLGVKEAADIVEKMEKGFELTSGGIQTIPPGFERGLDFSDDRDGYLDSDKPAPSITPVYRPMISSHFANGKADPTQQSGPELDQEVADLLPKDRPSVAEAHKATKRRPVIAKRDWAHVVDVNKELINFRELVPDMAKEYPFELDTFQKEAVYHMEQGDSVFVAAHTSAGKTVVAEYAIALSLKHMTRAIYTSPIKALSNQKFRDFKEVFGQDNVGILTGDVQINPEAGCLIMTTEILRSMLYKGADLIRDIEWVIFDEVHYVNDLERGVVWEEVIIMLPEHVGIILLSATVPNTKEFADWVGRTKQRDVYVISTAKRPVPLEHFLYAGKEMHQVISKSGEFMDSGLKAANEALRRKQDKEREANGQAFPSRGAVSARGSGVGRGSSRGGPPQRGAPAARGRGGGGAGRSGGQQDRNLWVHLIGLLRKKELLPVVVFTFSKKRCEENAASMPNTDLCTSSEKSEVHIVIERSLTRLKGSDKNLPQIAHMRGLLSRGIGVHHGGLLPIVKEVVEILFARGLVKVLFATETFAMGVNMPARCVVFSGIRKHDGHTFRELLAGEYTQMSGRAGRRGLDATGVVLVVCDGEVPESAVLHKMMLGSPTKLASQFRLTYNMILNLLRVEALKVEDMIKRSFSENATQRLAPDQQKKVTEGEKELSSMPSLDDSPRIRDIRQYYKLSSRMVALNQQVTDAAILHGSTSKLFTAGRVVILRDQHFPGSAAVILRPAPMYLAANSKANANGLLDTTKAFIVVAFVSPDVRSGSKDTTPEAHPPLYPARLAEKGDVLSYEVSVVPVTSFAMVTKHTIRVDVVAILDQRKRDHLDQALTDIQTVLPQVKTEKYLDAEADWSKIKSIEFRESINARNKLLEEQNRFALDLDDEFFDVYQAVHAEDLLHTKLANLRLSLSDQNLELLPDYEQRIAVLQELQFIDENCTVLLKGRVACEINSVNALILTELILENVLSRYEPEEVVGMLSALVFQEKSDATPFLTAKLQEGLDVMKNIAERISRIQTEKRADMLGEEPNSHLRIGLVEVAYEWARGMAFAQITDLTDVQEGTIVRAITRLDDTCREVRDAARVIGDGALYQKMEACQNLIKRDIIFTNSLYL